MAVGFAGPACGNTAPGEHLGAGEVVREQPWPAGQTRAGRDTGHCQRTGYWGRSTVGHCYVFYLPKKNYFNLHI